MSWEMPTAVLGWWAVRIELGDGLWGWNLRFRLSLRKRIKLGLSKILANMMNWPWLLHVVSLLSTETLALTCSVWSLVSVCPGRQHCSLHLITPMSCGLTCPCIRMRAKSHWNPLSLAGHPHPRPFQAPVSLGHLCGFMRVSLKCSQSVSPVICHSEHQGTTHPCKDTWGWHPTTSTYVSALQTVQMLLEIGLHFLVNTFFSSAFTFSFFVCFCFLAIPLGVWDLSSPTRDQTCASCTGSVESQPLHHQERPSPAFKLLLYLRKNSMSPYGNW